MWFLLSAKGKREVTSHTGTARYVSYTVISSLGTNSLPSSPTCSNSPWVETLRLSCSLWSVLSRRTCRRPWLAWSSPPKYTTPTLAPQSDRRVFVTPDYDDTWYLFPILEYILLVFSIGVGVFNDPVLYPGVLVGLLMFSFFGKPLEILGSCLSVWFTVWTMIHLV